MQNMNWWMSFVECNSERWKDEFNWSIISNIPLNLQGTPVQIPFKSIATTNRIDWITIDWMHSVESEFECWENNSFAKFPNDCWKSCSGVKIVQIDCICSGSKHKLLLNTRGDYLFEVAVKSLVSRNKKFWRQNSPYLNSKTASGRKRMPISEVVLWI